MKNLASQLLILFITLFMFSCGLDDETSTNNTTNTENKSSEVCNFPVSGIWKPVHVFDVTNNQIIGTITGCETNNRFILDCCNDNGGETIHYQDGNGSNTNCNTIDIYETFTWQKTTTKADTEYNTYTITPLLESYYGTVTTNPPAYTLEIQLVDSNTLRIKTNMYNGNSIDGYNEYTRLTSR